VNVPASPNRSETKVCPVPIVWTSQFNPFSSLVQRFRASHGAWQRSPPRRVHPSFPMLPAELGQLPSVPFVARLILLYPAQSPVHELDTLIVRGKRYQALSGRRGASMPKPGARETPTAVDGPLRGPGSGWAQIPPDLSPVVEKVSAGAPSWKGGTGCCRLGCR
jgi:hypothetical protein